MTLPYLALGLYIAFQIIGIVCIVRAVRKQIKIARERKDQ